MKLFYVSRKIEESTILSKGILLVHSEVFVVLHVVNVDPLCVQGDPVVKVPLGTLLDIVEGLVAPPALVPTEGPLRCEDWGPYQAEVLGDDGIRVLRRNKEVQVAEATCRDRREGYVSRLVVVAHPPVLGLGIVVVDTDP